MKNSTKIFGLILFASGIVLIFLDIWFLNNPEYRSMVKWWYIALLCGGGIGVYIMPDKLIIDYIKKFLNKKLK